MYRAMDSKGNALPTQAEGEACGFQRVRRPQDFGRLSCRINPPLIKAEKLIDSKLPYSFTATVEVAAAQGSQGPALRARTI
ncbi:MAG: hypothetical protein ACXV7F_11165, partial [Methylomonas sp.]